MIVLPPSVWFSVPRLDCGQIAARRHERPTDDITELLEFVEQTGHLRLLSSSARTIKRIQNLDSRNSFRAMLSLWAKSARLSAAQASS